ncbi:MmcQ/YjbR family DNA-binding protein [Streptosporangium pseudovulgare]|nr:MmcQ/YjbR family DNA-binding protein [Streptosporangium pseudovulgare]
MGVSVEEFLGMLDRLPEVEQTPGGDWISLKVRGSGFGYLWERTETVGLKATIEEQIALVAERPEVFEVQFTAGRFGWVVVHLAGIDADELFELVTEAWCLTAPKQLIAAHGVGPDEGEAGPYAREAERSAERAGR